LRGARDGAQLGRDARPLKRVGEEIRCPGAERRRDRSGGHATERAEERCKPTNNRSSPIQNGSSILSHASRQSSSPRSAAPPIRIRGRMRPVGQGSRRAVPRFTVPIHAQKAKEGPPWTARRGAATRLGSGCLQM